MLIRFPITKLLFAFLALTAVARAGETVTLAWDPNQEPDLAGYRLYWGLASRHYVATNEVGNVTEHTLLLPFDDENYFFAVTAYNEAGLESHFSDELTHPTPPVAAGANDHQLLLETDEDTSVLLDFARFPELPPIPADAEFVLAQPPGHGRLEGAVSELVYVPLPNYSGSDMFRLIVYERADELVTTLFKATVEVAIGAVNDPPVAVDDFAITTVGMPVTLQLPGYDVDGDALEYQVVEWPGHGRLLGDPPYFHYLPEPGYVGEDTLTFRVRDGNFESPPATITLSIQADSGYIRQQFQATAEDVPLEIDLSGALPDAGDDRYQYFIWDQPRWGTLEGDPPRMVYRPHPDASGLDRILYGIEFEDDFFFAETAIWILVEPVNDAPLAGSLEVETDQNSPLAIQLTGSDVEDAPLTYELLTLPAHGTLTGTAPELGYEPAPDFHGPDQFSYRVRDGELDSAEAIVSITVQRLELPLDELPTITSVTRATEGLEIVWTAIPGYTYRVVSSPGLDEVNWTAVSPELIAEGSTVSFTVMPEMAEQASFYAIRVLRRG